MLQCELLRLNVLLYIWSLSFQIAGAVILIIKYLFKTEKRILDEYFPGSNFADPDEKHYVKLDPERTQECAKKIYDNRMSFIFIAIGYVLSIFGDASEISKLYILFVVALSTVIIILLEKIISKKIAKIVYRDGLRIPCDKIKYKADILPNDTEMEDDINNMF